MPAGRHHRARFLAVVLGVVAVHGCVTRDLAGRMAELASAARMPARVEVAYVRELELAAPPAVAPGPAAVAPAAALPAAANFAASAASAAEALAAASAAEAAKAARAAGAARRAEAARLAQAERDAKAERAARAAAAAAAEAEASAAAALAARASAPASGSASVDVARIDAVPPAALVEPPPPFADARPTAPPQVTSTTVPAPGASASGIDAPRPAADAASRAPVAAPGGGSAALAGAASGGEPFDWPASTRVSFVLNGNYRGAVNGQAQVEWIRIGPRYQVHLDLLVGPPFAPIIQRRMRSEGDLTVDGLAPSRYDEDTQIAFRDRRRVTMAFEPDAVVLANGQRRERWRGVQDTASQFVQLTWLFTTRPELLRVGGTVEVPLALPRSMDRWIYDVLEEVELQTPFGPLATFHLKPRRATQRAGDLSAEIWFAPRLRYLPVKIRIEQDPQTYVDLMIAKKPELAAR